MMKEGILQINPKHVLRYEVVSGTQVKEAMEHSDKEIDKLSESE